ncbi:MAG: GIY-YIG nuclease family protein [Clostridia bacterium]|nr:GIY-YIG nuclease family protein [Clostridia bacterium]
MKDIYLSSIFMSIDPYKYKIHFARVSPDGTEPLNDYVADFENWKYWNMYSKSRDDFNRDYIFSLISFYPERDTWLFGGIWRVVSRDMSKVPYPYEVELVDEYSEYIGRLKIKYPYKDRGTRVKLEHHFKELIVKELLEEPFSTLVFPGYRNIDIPFITLEAIMKKDAPAWKNALSIKGIYLITDTKTGKKYVGKADGEHGIWQRWGDYIYDGHGGDVDLKKLVDSRGFDYVRQHFKFSILETITGWDEYDINDRESHWKRVLMSRMEEVGHNKN